jgi:dUTP pyrophosphatase
MKIKRLRPNAIAPSYAHPGDSGMDLCSTETIAIRPSESALIKTGWAIALHLGFEAQIRPRSGLALKHQITVLNTPGTVDQGYRGEIGVILINHGRSVFTVETGMKIAQMVICPVHTVDLVEVDDLDETERSDGGFGSTGVFDAANLSIHPLTAIDGVIYYSPVENDE